MPNPDESLSDEMRPIFNQTRVEHEMLGHAKEALMATLEWQTEGDTFTRKLSSLRFAAFSFQQHLERILAIEECDGYMTFVIDECPHHSDKVKQLQSEHTEFRGNMNAIMTKLNRLTPTDHEGLKAIRHDIVNLLRRFSDHSQRELALLLTAMNDDLGHGD